MSDPTTTVDTSPKDRLTALAKRSIRSVTNAGAGRGKGLSRRAQAAQLSAHEELIDEITLTVEALEQAIDSLRRDHAGRLNVIGQHLAVTVERADRTDASIAETNRSIEATRDHLAAISNHLDGLSADLNKTWQQVLAGEKRFDPIEAFQPWAKAEIGFATTRLDELAARLDQLDQGSAATKLLNEQADEMGGRLDEVAYRVLVIEDELNAAPYVANREFIFTHDDGQEVLGFDTDVPMSPDELYVAFENLFRGDVAEIADRQRGYLDLLPADGLIADLGCGRGEMLGLLREAGHDAIGVDLDEGMVAECRRQDFNVELADAISWLENQPEHSLAAVFSAQFIEHIPPPELERLFRATARALRPGGVMIAETVNPHSTRAAKAFWVDLTHQHPIYPEVVVALARLTGFGTGRIVFPHGSGAFRQDLVSQGEYALVATTVPQPLVSAGQDRGTESADDALEADSHIDADD